MIWLGERARRWAASVNPWTNVYGLARTVLALGTAATLSFSHSTTLFRPAAGLLSAPFCDGLRKISLFCIFPRDSLELARWVGVSLLLLVASGWRPRVTGIFHWWVSYSLQASAITLDGGDHVATVLTLLLLPVTLTDRRRWHWESGTKTEPRGFREMETLLALSGLAVIRIQVAGIYFHSSVAKFAVREWADGTALYYWFLDPAFGAPSWLLPLLMPLLKGGVSVSLLTWGSMLLEVFLFMGLVMPKRYWGILLWFGLAFHAGIALVHGLPSFSFAMAAALLLYLRPVEKEFRLRIGKSHLPTSSPTSEKKDTTRQQSFPDSGLSSGVPAPDS